MPRAHTIAVLVPAVFCAWAAASAQLPVSSRSSTSITAATAQGEALPDDYLTRIAPSVRLLVDSVASDSSWVRHVYFTAKRDGTLRFDRSAAPEDSIGRRVEEKVAKAGAARVFTPLPLGWDDSLSVDMLIVHPPAGLPLPDTSGAYFEFQVDRRVSAVSVPTPEYPPSLRAAAVAGRVLARFIVGTDGRVEPGSFKVLQSAAPEFSEAVRVALERATYRPAELKGRKVRQVMMQPYDFSVR
ncbi:MAG TPA: energy transducer TonB [Gemmatimonadaceae bacterium]